MERPALLCYDDSEGARVAIRSAGAVLGGGPALVATVWQRAHADPLARVVPALGPAIRDAVIELDGYAAEAALKHAAEGCALAADAGFAAQPLALESQDAVWEALIAAADDHDAGVIVLGRRGLSPVSAALLGSVSTGVLHHAARPVLIVPSKTVR
ncbi:MAG: hypothetical protein QOJ07_2212 [Thermoleophilaceae bacterium]|jgi:nucleotide-binding universal stress UspA family protein|nr:hypothetical protein [Thermoleophilaceae bacterium]